jgi:hypothetical protein
MSAPCRKSITRVFLVRIELMFHVAIRMIPAYDPRYTGPVTDPKKALVDYISSLAVQRGDFTLTSGKKATFYVDLRAVSLDHTVAPVIGDVMCDLISEF